MFKFNDVPGWLFPIFASLPLLAGSIGAPVKSQAVNNHSVERSIRVLDAIATTRLATPGYFNGYDAKGRVAVYSPDGRLFVIALRKGNLEKNTNEFSLLLFGDFTLP